ncbi:unnamed protein product [Microthlaspi erraticum]|uniref:Uncharacterized protein n=1 Tax=Microthlaspi erraticum TaxID=1685480 RepID=A0A6D2IVU4_9BRAS|nr:unnamed protein product [Microthlaspi erraticum]
MMLMMMMMMHIRNIPIIISTSFFRSFLYIDDEMGSKSTANGVLRQSGGSLRCYPYASGTVSRKEDVKEEVVRLGVELSLSVAESMFLLCDDVGTMLWFCYKLWKYTLPPSDLVSEKLLRVIHYVYSNDIKPKNGAYLAGGSSVQWELIRTTWKDFTDGIIILHRLVSVLRRKDCSFDDRLLSSAITKYKQQVLKKLEDKLRSAKHVSEGNGFARDTMESNISDLWKSLFEQEAGQATHRVTRSRILSDLFQPILDESWHSDIPTLPVYSPYILGTDFAKQEMRKEVVGLGVELSLYVAESMFLLCDDIRGMLLFCFKLWRDVKRDLKPCSPVVERLLRVMHHVYSKNIKPKNEVYQISGKSAQWELVRSSLESFDTGIRDVHNLVLILEEQGSWADGREFTSRVEEALKKIEEKLRCARHVSEMNGFVRDAMESDIEDLWETLFDKETEEAWSLKVTREEILSDLFHPILSESGKDFARQDLEEESVRLGVEVSLYVAESMFLLCDDIHSMLRFCWNIWRDVKKDLKPGSPVGDRLLGVMHYVYAMHIKPKNGVYEIGGKSVQWELTRNTWESSDAGIRDLDKLVSFVRLQGSCANGREFTSRIQESLKKVEEKLICAKDVSEANGFVRDVMESNILGLWETLFDKETEEAAWTRGVMRDGILKDLFQPLLREEAAKH